MPDALDTRQLRRFGLLVGGIFATIAGWPLLLRGQAPHGWAAVIAAALMILGLTVPGALRPVLRLWLRVGHLLGWFNTRILLTLVYFVVMTPTGLAMRLIGRDPLDRRLRDRSSYWRDKPRQTEPRASMERHF